MRALDGALCVVTGGAGFIGLHLSRALVAAGARVTVIDDLSTSRPEARAILAGLGPGLRFVHHDVTTPIEITGDILFNLACPAAPRMYQRDPLRTWKTSVLGALHLGDRAAAQGMTFVHASTSEIYGNPQQHPQGEAYWGHVALQGPRACYDEGKRAAETYLSDLARLRRLDLRIARIFNTYGPGMALGDGRVVVNFVEQALQGQPLSLYGNGQQTRALCHVADLVRGLIAMAVRPQARGHTINLGNPAEVTIGTLARLVREITGADVPVLQHPLPEHDPVRRCPDISRARELLQWEPRIDLRTGLAEVVRDVADRLQVASRPSAV